jgi:hypothetical protein
MGQLVGFNLYSPAVKDDAARAALGLHGIEHAVVRVLRLT